MANAQKVKLKKRQRKALRVRNGVRGSQERPRLSVFRSSKFIYCQAIDDGAGRTLASASELEQELRERCSPLTKTQAAALLGEIIAERLKSKGVEKVVFDRGWYRYHGRVKALADGARKGGLKF